MFKLCISGISCKDSGLLYVIVFAKKQHFLWMKIIVELITTQQLESVQTLFSRIFLIRNMLNLFDNCIAHSYFINVPDFREIAGSGHQPLK